MERKKIIVAMSGGVDSSVAAALLVREGHEVVGAFMKNWSDQADPCTGGCSWQDERADALRVAAVLGIPFETYDFEKEYRDSVVGYLTREYAAGRTPNPDVMCNKLVKFDLFLRRALDAGADMIATGHYARVRSGAGGQGDRGTGQTENRKPKTENATFSLLAGIDRNKDQSYFLHRLDQDQLSRTLFPIGHLEKPAVRALAREFGLPTAEKKDSQGICFVGKVDLKGFLSSHIKEKAGPIVTTGGRVLGRHRGMAPFTVGQRHGLAVGGGPAWYVVEKDAARNAVVVGQEGDPELFSTALLAADAHWIAGEPPAFPLRCEARIRYRQPLQRATVERADDGLLVRFDEPQRAVTPGQFAVFYSGDECLGGAVIDRAAK